ncbi:MAG: hypothetical protein COT81_03100 [Candidatus Buchananbacteria bacterium CG10_big_fil_rev_8_21_14_0_10_42_9]|uniref:CDP-diacylglycerol--glycerol-3-phosphate 3-phosphatidyltransferase n=1 Tax=Candidatus Buchananbacteria bacterium CG10_big_fil_rev_8_21_14_0_10_42_9 TaxID=1974526 RepID=A0A2H0W123_9BACT|nr:MAG: hypothetical protein COT81_03100 [Candidatus Buchananbacteria bacterium CG10_big_fil_rev_8_21_14_0_10_42_9]
MLETHSSPKIYPQDKLLAKTILPFIPHSVKPNHVTILRFILTPFVLWLLITGNYTWGIPAFLITAFTDAIDGSMARTRDQITELGKAIDPIADKLLISTVLLVTALPYFYYTTIIVILLDISFIIAGWIYKSRGEDISANVWGKIKMTLQAISFTLLLIGIITQSPILFYLSLGGFFFAILFATISLHTRGI